MHAISSENGALHLRSRSPDSDAPRQRGGRDTADPHPSSRTMIELPAVACLRG
jgi:hypothetical protein